MLVFVVRVAVCCFAPSSRLAESRRRHHHHHPRTHTPTHTQTTTKHQQAKADDGEELDDLVSAPRMVLQQLIAKHFPVRGVNMTQDELNKLQVQVR